MVSAKVGSAGGIPSKTPLCMGGTVTELWAPAIQLVEGEETGSGERSSAYFGRGSGGKSQNQVLLSKFFIAKHEGTISMDDEVRLVGWSVRVAPTLR